MRTRRTLLVLLLSLALTGLVWVNHSQAAAGTADASAPAESVDTLASGFNWDYAGVENGDKLGHAVHTAGDVNGDGYDDVIVGAPQYTHDVYREGAAFVFYGGPFGLSAAPNWVAGGGVQGVSFGGAVGTAGDVNGDGYDDVVVGAYEYKGIFDGVLGEPKSGAVFVFHGSESGLSTTPDWYVLADAPEIRLGWAVSTAGDVDHDGYDDLIVSAPHFDDEGLVYLYLGGPDGLADDPAWRYECNRSNAQCGFSLDAAGDVNNDDYDDIIIGAPNCNALIDDEGCAMVFFGSDSGLSLTANWTLEGDQEDANYGKSVAGAGDINDDGYDDILVGSPKYTQDDEVPQAGAAFGYYGSDTGPSLTPDWVTYGQQADSRYGDALSTAGDVDNDGYDDVIVGAYLMGDNGVEDEQPDEGGVYLFNGSPLGLGTITTWTANGSKAEAWFGYSVGTAGDVDGDLEDDLIIGSPNYKFDEQTVVGKAFAAYSLDPGPQHTIYLPVIVLQTGE